MAFLVNGAEKSFADVIIEHKGAGGSCMVASYGFGVKQVEKIIQNFDTVTLVADSSHSQLNPRAYSRVVELSEILDNFRFAPTKIHAKFAVINGEIVIFTSANLSANRRLEVYLVGQKDDVDGVGEVIAGLGDPGGLLSGPTEWLSLDGQNFETDFDWCSI